MRFSKTVHCYLNNVIGSICRTERKANNPEINAMNTVTAAAPTSNSHGSKTFTPPRAASAARA